jgi:hypothetical protein
MHDDGLSKERTGYADPASGSVLMPEAVASRRRIAMLRHLALAVALLVLIALLVARFSAGPTAVPRRDVVGTAAPLGATTPTPVGAPTPTPATTSAPPSQTHVSDAATARSLVARYEATSATGDDVTAWSLLAAWSQNQFPTRQSFADSRRVRFAGDAAAYVIGEPRTDDPSIPGWLAKGAPEVSDPGRVLSVEVTHPNASPAALRRELFFVALDESGTWKVWALN